LKKAWAQKQNFDYNENINNKREDR
jgi:hypothetical protein